MMSMLATVQPNSAWKLWIEHVMKNRLKYGFQSACMVQHNGAVSAASKGFHPTSKEVQAINLIFMEKLNNNIASDRLSVKGKTYMVKTISRTQIVAFNGAKYVIINRSKSKHIIALCDSKEHYMEAADWLCKLSQKLVEKGF